MFRTELLFRHGEQFSKQCHNPTSKNHFNVHITFDETCFPKRNGDLGASIDFHLLPSQEKETYSYLYHPMSIQTYYSCFDIIYPKNTCL